MSKNDPTSCAASFARIPRTELETTLDRLNDVDRIITDTSKYMLRWHEELPESLRDKRRGLFVDHLESLGEARRQMVEACAEISPEMNPGHYAHEASLSAPAPKARPLGADPRGVREALAYLSGALEQLADLAWCLDDLTRTDGKRGFTKAQNREAGLRHYLAAVADIRAAQRDLASASREPELEQLAAAAAAPARRATEAIQ